ncbi:MAG TPA: LytTR family DNA-binding domain-containing protein [Puia sp.]|nr:LytTR family DNA-binding domain-containing protein [Puia sp.]
MIKLDCLVIDDEPNAGKLLEDYIAKIPHLTLKGKCYNAMEAMEFLGHTPVDLIFLDINMPRLSGMELAHLLPRHQKIIFTTAYSEYAIESYEYNVIDYLLKPISFKRFLKAIEKTEQIIHEQPSLPPPAEDYIFVKSDKKMIRITLRDILYFEAVKEYIYVHMDNQKILIYKRMKDLAEKLPADFIRVHNSYIINCKHIGRIEGNFVQMRGESIPLGISYKEQFLQFIRTRAL